MAPFTRIVTPYGVDQTTPFWLENLDRCNKRIAALKEAVGGEAASDQLPILEIREVSELDHLSLDNLPHPIMRGTDLEGRMFIALRLKQRAEGGETFAVSFCQCAKYADQWTQKTTTNQFVFTGNFKADTDAFAALIKGTHPEFQIV